MLALSLLALRASHSSAATPPSHGWDSVRDVMAMHGKFTQTAVPTDADVKFVAENYPMATTGTSCSGLPTGQTIEESVQAVGARIRALQPDIKLGMYYRTDFAMELAECSGFASEWAAHPEWRLKDDAGHVVGKPGHWNFDYLNPGFRDFFARVIVNVPCPRPGPLRRPTIAYVYLAGAPGQAQP
eukprot:gene1724-2895_t